MGIMEWIVILGDDIHFHVLGCKHFYYFTGNSMNC